VRSVALHELDLVKEKNMSYLDVPRLHFAGNFVAQPSTVNNSPHNFNPKVKIDDKNSGWNPDGNHAWQFANCSVKTAVNASGPTSGDPVIGAGVLSVDQPVVAKLVDLDTEQQMVSQIWGLQVKVAVSDTEYFMGNFRVVCFNDIWMRVIGGGGDAAFSAYYQSVLDDVTWGAQLTSPLLKKLKQVSPGTLSIKFVVDGFDEDTKQGRIVGTIGPAWKNEPSNFVLGRFLRPRDYDQRINPFGGTTLWFGPVRVDAKRGKLLVDLGNSIPTTAPGGGPPTNLGTLQVAIMTSPTPTVLGQYDYSQATYEATAGIQEFSVTPQQLKTLSKTPLGVRQLGTSNVANPNPLLRENANGAYINTTQQVYRMSPGDTANAEVIALAFGEPAAKQSVAVQFDNFQLSIQEPSTPPPMPVGVPHSALTFLASAKTGADGHARFKLTASDPGNPRKYIDGQVYGVGYSWSKEADAHYPPDPNNFLSVLVFNSVPPDATPTWLDVEPIFAQYAKLYPFMTGRINLASYTEVVNNLDAIKGVLSLPQTDPRYMQVTRDMSPDKVSMILQWIKLGAPPAPPARPRRAAKKTGTTKKTSGAKKTGGAKKSR
jgi:hypothetical protein